jgi:hypothetical protein
MRLVIVTMAVAMAVVMAFAVAVAMVAHDPSGKSPLRKPIPAIACSARA